jgi:hypothetical protein
MHGSYEERHDAPNVILFPWENAILYQMQHVEISPLKGTGTKKFDISRLNEDFGKLMTGNCRERHRASIFIIFRR